MAKPDGREAVRHEDPKDVVHILNPIVWQRDTHFNSRQEQDPDLSLLPRRVSLFVTFDVSENTEVEEDSLE